MTSKFAQDHPVLISFLTSVTLGRTLGAGIAFLMGLLFSSINARDVTMFVLVSIALAEIATIDVVVFLLGMQNQETGVPSSTVGA